MYHMVVLQEKQAKQQQEAKQLMNQGRGALKDFLKGPPPEEVMQMQQQQDKPKPSSPGMHACGCAEGLVFCSVDAFRCTEGLQRRLRCTMREEGFGNANPAARNLGNYHGTWEITPFVDRIFERGVIIATFLSVLSIVPPPPDCARLTHFFHPNLREINAVLGTPQDPSPAAPAARLRCGCGAQEALPQAGVLLYPKGFMTTLCPPNDTAPIHSPTSMLTST